MSARILAIDDEQEILDLYQDILADSGYQVHCIKTRLEDTSLIEKFNPDLVICDLMFGYEPAGWNLVQKIIENPATAQIPVIVSTAANVYAKKIEEQLKANRIALVLKPFDIDYLIDLVEKTLADHKRA